MPYVAYRAKQSPNKQKAGSEESAFCLAMARLCGLRFSYPSRINVASLLGDVTQRLKHFCAFQRAAGGATQGIVR